MGEIGFAIVVLTLLSEVGFYFAHRLPVAVWEHFWDGRAHGVRGARVAGDWVCHCGADAAVRGGLLLFASAAARGAVSVSSRAQVPSSGPDADCAGGRSAAPAGDGALHGV